MGVTLYSIQYTIKRHYTVNYKVALYSIQYTVYSKVAPYSIQYIINLRYTVYSKVDEIIKRSDSSTSLNYTPLIAYVSEWIISGTAALLWLFLPAAPQILLQNDSRQP